MADDSLPSKQKLRAMETEEDRRSRLGVTNLVQFIFYSISRSGKTVCHSYIPCVTNLLYCLMIKSVT